MSSSLNQLRDKAFAYAKGKGFHEEPSSVYKFGVLIALIHSELSEALEADRAGRWLKGKFNPLEVWPTFEDITKEKYESYVKGSVEEELADALIRIFDLAGFYGVDLDWHVDAKMAYNETRSKKHGKKY